MSELIITLDENKHVSVTNNCVEDAEVIYLLMSCLIKTSKMVHLECEEVTETLEEFWENVK